LARGLQQFPSVDRLSKPFHLGAYMTLTPSYGRDYKSARAVKADWKADKDFTIASMGSDCGRYCNRSDLIGNESTVTIRYNRLRNIVMIKVPSSK